MGTSVKGKLFEFFVCKLLLFCGFKPVNQDGLLIYEGSAGTMIQGLGQPHNADVLLEPPFQTPFYFPTRLLIECKCYSDKCGLTVIRNALGLREDINRLDVVTEDILRNRQASRTTKTKSYPMKRYSYQVGVASINGFKDTAYSFAQTHRIPLISFAENKAFKEVRECINEIEKKACQNENYAREVLKFIKTYQYEKYLDLPYGQLDNSFIYFIEEIGVLQNNIVVGLLEDGTIIFMVKLNAQNDYSKKDRYYDGCEIHWSDENVAWELYDGCQRYAFELPKEIYEEWIESEDRRMSALDIKERCFSKIVLFENGHDERSGVRTIYLSKQFIEKAKRDFDVKQRTNW